MTTIPLDPFGVTLTGVSVRSIVDCEEQVEHLHDLLAEHGVVVLPDQTIDDDLLVVFLRALGEITTTVGEPSLAGHPELNVVSNVGRSSPPRSQFHTDTSYVAHPPDYTALRAVQVPTEGGQTVFADQYRAYETLDPELRRELEGRTVTHVATGVELGSGDEVSAEHPLFRRHPRSGRTALYLSTPQRCAAISGMDEVRSAETVRLLLEHSTRPENLLRHAWRPHDLVVWDNRCVLHKADHSGVVGDRVMHRGMVLVDA